MRYRIGELGVGGILDQAITLTKNHFVLLFSITLVLMIPFLLIMQIVSPQIDLRALLAAKTPEDYKAVFQASSETSSFASLLGILYGFVVVPLTEAAIIQALAGEYLEKPTSVTGAFRRAGKVFFPLVGTSILATLAISVGTCFCLVPGIIFTLFFILRTEIVVIEGVYFIEALKRSWKLVKGNVGTIFVLGILVFVIYLAISGSAALLPHSYFTAILSSLLQTALFIFGTAIWVVFYFSCRSRAENFDLTMLADAVGTDAPDLPQSDVDH